MLQRKSPRKDGIPAWGWWVIGGFLGIIAAAWMILSGFANSVIEAVPALIRFVFGILVIIAFIYLYFIPSIQARKTPRFAAIFVANFAFGWTGIGWIAVLIWSLAEVGTMNARKPPPPYP